MRIYYDDDAVNDDDAVVCFCLGKGFGKSHVCLYPEGKEFQVQLSEHMSVNIWW